MTVSNTQATTQTVIAQARAQGVPEAQITQLEAQLGGLMSQATTLVQQSSPSGSVQVPTQALQAMAGAMQPQGMQAQQLGLPALPGFLGDGGIDTLIDYLINGLATAVSMIPIIGGPMATIIKQVAGSLKAFLVNNALAGGVVNALAQAQEYAKVLQEIMGYTDLDKLLGLGETAVADRLNAALGGAGGTRLTVTPTTPADIAAATQEAQNSTLAGLQGIYARFGNDPYLQATGVSKYTSPLTATAEIASMVGQYQAAELTNKGVRATGQSLTALASGDEIVDRTGKNVATAMQQGLLARTGVASATTTLGAMTIQTGLMEQANTLNAMNAAAVTAMLRQNLAAQDATLQATTALLDDVIKARRENAVAAQQQMKRLQDSNVVAAQTAAASVSSLANLGLLGTVTAADHPVKGPYGEAPFLK